MPTPAQAVDLGWPSRPHLSLFRKLKLIWNIFRALAILQSTHNKNMQINKSNIRELLFKGPTTVTFTKKDGTLRIMECTLAQHLLPIVETTKTTTSTSIENENLVKAYDLENQGWRSFNVSSVISISSINE